MGVPQAAVQSEKWRPRSRRSLPTGGTPLGIDRFVALQEPGAERLDRLEGSMLSRVLSQPARQDLSSTVAQAGVPSLPVP